MTNDESLEDSFGPDRQRELFFRGVAGETPDVPLDFQDLRTRAREEMDEGAYGYVAGSAGREETAKDNESAFSNWKIHPRVLKGIEDRTLKTSIMGQSVPSPVLLAPIGVQSIIHPEGARASAKAANNLGVPFIHSTVSSYSIEQIAELSGDEPLWFQLYWSELPELNKNLINRAEDAGYDAIVVTIDTFLMGWRPRDLAQGYFPFLEGEGLANYISDPVFRDHLDTSPEENLDDAIALFIDIFSNPSANWDDLEEIQQLTDLPFLVKGILHPDDASKAQNIGVDGIIVSNHGGRQIDGEIPAADALDDIVQIGFEDLSILFDSGIRTGSDVLKAYALGADAVLLGRPYLYGLALEGSNGVEDVLKNILAELDITMGLSGHTDINEVDREVLTPVSD